jgi:hypothetical protein
VLPAAFAWRGRNRRLKQGIRVSGANLRETMIDLAAIRLST